MRLNGLNRCLISLFDVIENSKIRKFEISKFLISNI